MDPTRFDTLVRAFASGSTRRAILAALAALPLGGLLTALDDDEASAERPRDRLKRRHQQRNRKRRNQHRRNKNNNNNGGGGGGGGGLGSPGPCTANGQACNQNSDCCSENCFGQVCAATVTQCGATCDPAAPGCCPNDGCCGSPANQCNGAGLCCAPNCGGRECGPDGCGNSGTCGACKNNQTCNTQTGQCQGGQNCSPRNCPNGCCDGNGDCQPGNTGQACGTDGETCSACLPGQTCSAAGTCQGTPICNAEVCPLGCCDENNNCQPGTSASFCGANGEACVTCLPAEFCSLVSRHCEEEFPCSENTCNGCCDSAGTCQPGTEKAACGTGGITCRNCPGSAATCADGGCECTPSCQGKSCGDDGCAGSCGTCPINQFCDEQNNPTNWQCADKCTLDNCPNGCCDATGTCQPGNTNGACGTFGRSCKTCDPTCQECLERSGFNGLGVDWICAQRCECGECGCLGCPDEARCDAALQLCCVEPMEFTSCSDNAPCCAPSVCGITVNGAGCCYPNGVVNPQRDVKLCCGLQPAMDENGACCMASQTGGCT